MADLLGWISDHINQGFNWTSGNAHAHSGVDYNVSYGTPLGTPLAGTIIDALKEPWGGQVDERVNVGGHDFILSWLHLSDISQVFKGEHVNVGQQIGVSGSPPLTGPNAYKYGNGPHLHFEVTAGDLAPYIGYSPWRPTSSSFPVNPVGFIGGAIPNFTNPLDAAQAGGDALGAIASALGKLTDPAKLQAAFQYVLERGALAALAFVVIVVGLLLLFWEPAKQAVVTTGQRAGDAVKLGAAVAA